MKKAFTADTTAAAELFTPSPAPEQKKTAKKEAPAEAVPVFTWRAAPDGEKRDRRLQIAAKPSIANKAASLARTRGISLAYLFETLIADEWNKENTK